MFDGFDIAMFAVSLPWLMEEWNLSPVQAGAVGSYSLVGMMVEGDIARHGARPAGARAGVAR